MIRGEHLIVQYDYRGGIIVPDRLMRTRHAAYLPAAADAIDAYRTGTGRTRQTLHRTVTDRFDAIDGCPPRRSAALCKLLDDRSTYESAGDAVNLRRRVFDLGATLHPIVAHRDRMFEHDHAAAHAAVESAIGQSWEEVRSRMFADVIELQRQQTFDDLDASDLLAAYNLAQTQAALYRAAKVEITAARDASTILRHAKLAGLMHRIEKLDPGYRLTLDGPASSLRGTTRYGVHFARLLPKILTLTRWRWRAAVRGPRDQWFELRIAPEDGLTSPLDPPSPYDSQLERDFAAAWEKHPVAGWTLTRDAELLHRGQTVVTPDFALRHDDGRYIHVEIVGFWTPEYLREKAARLARFTDDHHRWLLVFPRSGSAEAETVLAPLNLPTIRFGKRTRPADWIAAVE